MRIFLILNLCCALVLYCRISYGSTGRPCLMNKINIHHTIEQQYRVSQENANNGCHQLLEFEYPRQSLFNFYWQSVPAIVCVCVFFFGTPCIDPLHSLTHSKIFHIMKGTGGHYTPHWAAAPFKLSSRCHTWAHFKVNCNCSITRCYCPGLCRSVVLSRRARVYCFLTQSHKQQTATSWFSQPTIALTIGTLWWVDLTKNTIHTWWGRTTFLHNLRPNIENEFQ